MKDKLLVWLSGDVLHFCMSHFLNKKFGYDINAIIDVPNKPKIFFQNQKFVDFQNVWYFHEHLKDLSKKPNLDYLKKFEKEYDINLQQLAINERIFYRFNDFYNFSSDEILNILEYECRLFEEIIDKAKPDFFLTPLTAFHHHQLFYEMCRKKDIKTLVIYMSKFGHRCVISQEVNKLDFEPQLNSFESMGRNFNELLDNFQSFNISKQIDDYKKSFGGSKLTKIQAVSNFLFYNYSTNKTHYTYYGRKRSKVVLNEIKKNNLVRNRKSFIDKKLLKKIPKNYKLVYYPLHIEQERNLLIAAPFYINQIELIRNIVQSLPIEYKLIVKEHPAQETREWRNISEYEEIMDIPNVFLMHPEVSSNEILKKSSLVITIGGTSGLEANFYQIPSIILSEMDYSVLPSTEFVNNIQDLPEKIKQSLQKKVVADDLDKFVQLYQKNSFEFDYMQFVSKYCGSFYYNGNLLDAEINAKDMKSFIDENQEIILKVTNEHIKKIEQFKKLSSK
ncbi:hypothetical protein A7X95_06035 [Candidatus Nitrosopelagicus brevis]|uniref:Capsule polysaccharide biosynthesis protein n=1 Tax=Candidatus Nitrosopelagicus brevis TaxID=1410606 RepID=A0A0A7V199_9ARCH|nr:hypothetical protein [Candidatus Nitrosopelagicus brevis]AJA92832.1 capsule polysaccharide biosynthesis protein [Candidatus Nitrosopelagicus brevis]PTL87449.1 hypothetical protein A7X95_06035 [Candidatus Nitrosopelagicus brevis]|tara:strand:- start:1499 stop:3010 length:1512 start_codon:yes stop_codon:yes gene_type:complete